jgi:S-adenosylmethionine synthetase
MIQLSYAIGVAQPVSIYVDTNGTGRVADNKIAAFIKKNVDLTPKGIMED